MIYFGIYLIGCVLAYGFVFAEYSINDSDKYYLFGIHVSARVAALAPAICSWITIAWMLVFTIMNSDIGKPKWW